MNAMVRILILLSVFLLFACATTQEKKEQPQFKVGELILSKGIDKTETSAKPIDIASSFLKKDLNVIASIKIEKLTGVHELRWDWYDPKGEIFTSSGPYSIHTSEGKYREVTTAWHRLNIKDERAGDYLGSWQVMLFIDGKLIKVKDFTIE